MLLVSLFSLIVCSCLPFDIDKGPLEFSERFSEVVIDNDIDNDNGRFDNLELRVKVERMIEKKCMNCHGNGMRLGGFGGFEDLDSLVKEGILFDLENPSESLFYLESESGDMPLNPRDRLSDEELADLLEWVGSLKL